jgi:hypothetical protein
MGVWSAQELYAGSCLCVTRNRENEVISFSCTELAGTDGGNAGCSNFCQKKGFAGYDWLAEETCSSLYKKIKSQTIKLNLKDIHIGPVGIGLGGTASIEAQYDNFYIPDGYGGGKTTTKDFTGTIQFRLDPDPTDKDRYLVVLTDVSTTVQSLDLNGFQTGVLHGSINKDAPNSGELNVKTGEINFLFSQILSPEVSPGTSFHTWSYYHGTCNNCLNGGTATLNADSFYISPVE